MQTKRPSFFRRIRGQNNLAVPPGVGASLICLPAFLTEAGGDGNDTAPDTRAGYPPLGQRE